MRALRLRFACTYCLAVAALALPLAAPADAGNRLVNMVPNSRSGETNQDAEPTITVDPNDFARMAGAAFTWDNLAASPMATTTAPIYVSTDRGNNWTLAFIVPSVLGSTFPTGDITLSFSSTASGGAHPSSWLYTGILSAQTGRPMTVLRSQDPFGSTLMTSLDTRSGNVDQPHTIVKTSGGGADRLYVGFNNGYSCIVPGGRTATLDVSQDAKATTPTFVLDVIEARNTACQDGFAEVAAPHEDGTVYAAFYANWSSSPRLVVVRDDNWGAGAAPFRDLTDPSDGVAGRFVTTALTLASGTMGQNRLGASNVSIAVDPTNSDRVYVAWGDSNGSNSETIHVRRSVNRGVDWSADLVTVQSAMNPQVAIDAIGVAGLLYQGVVSGKWETRIARTNDFDAANFVLPGLLLASQSTATPTATFSPYIGDYASLVTAGNSFVGMFSASNVPDKANFMTGVRYQREVNWTTHQLFTSSSHTTTVAASIDPFFFEVETGLCDKWFGCNICKLNPRWCWPVAYDPWWRFKCPMCGIQILVNPGDPIERVSVFDSRGERVGKLERLHRPVVVKDVGYAYGITLEPKEGVGYVLKAEPGKGKEVGSFHPAFAVKRIEAEKRPQ